MLSIRTAAALLWLVATGAAASSAAAQESPWAGLPAPVAHSTYIEAVEAAQREDCASAEPLARTAFDAQAAELGNDHWATIRTSVWLGGCMVVNGGDGREAGFAMLESALRWYDNQGAAARGESTRVEQLLSQLMRNNRNFAGLERLERRNLESLQRFASTQPAGVRMQAAIQDSRRKLATLADAQGRRAEADALHAVNAGELNANLARLMPLLRLTPPALSFNGIIGQSTDDQAEAIQLIGAMAEQARAIAASRRTEDVERMYRDILALAEISGGRETIFYIRTLSDLGEFYFSQGRVAEAEAELIRSVDLRERTYTADSPQRLPGYSALSSFYRNVGRLRDAERTLLQIIDATAANRTTSETLFGNSAGIIAAQVALADLYTEQGRFGDAEIVLTNALRARNNQPPLQVNQLVALLAPGAAGVGRVIEQGITIATARLWLRQGAHEQAAQLILDAHDVTQPVTRTGIPYVMALGEIRAAQGRWSDAVALYQRALDARGGAGATMQRWSIAERLAEAELGLGEFVTAQNRFQALIDEASPLLGDRHPLVVSALSGVATAMLRQRRGVEALVPGRRLVAAHRNAAAGAFDHFARAQEQGNLRSNRGALLLADALWQAVPDRGREQADILEEVFGALQDGMTSAASIDMLRAAGRREAEAAGPETAAFVQQHEQLAMALAQNRSRFAGALGRTDDAAEAQRQGLALERASLEAALSQSEQRLRARLPDYFALLEPRSVALDAAQALLAPDEAMLLIIPTPFGTHSFALTSSGRNWAQSNLTEVEVNHAVQQLRRDLGATFNTDGAAERADPTTFTYDRATAHTLYNALIEPNADLLQGKRRLVIVAGGALAALPFHVLVTAPPSGADDDPAALRATSWFGDAFDLVHATSVQSVALLRNATPRQPVSDRFMGVGDPVMAGSSMTYLRQLARLPGTARELEAVRAALNAGPESLLMAGRATEANLRSAALGDQTIILFSTHGLTATDAANAGLTEAGLVLTPPATANEGDDGFLAASEIATMRLHADWIILSACNTASNDAPNQEGLGELSRAFLFAGARTLLASHWPVSDAVAPLLITRTLVLERDGRTRAAAFRDAMREIRNDPDNDNWAHPFFWAPFVLIGD